MGETGHTNEELVQYYRELGNLKTATQQAAENLNKLSPDEKVKFVHLIEEKGEDPGRWFTERGIDPSLVPGTKAYEAKHGSWLSQQGVEDPAQVVGTAAHRQTGEYRQVDPTQVTGTKAQLQTREVNAINSADIPGTKAHQAKKWSNPWEQTSGSAKPQTDDEM